jgi:predicted MFS family arabinose efflux permease
LADDASDSRTDWIAIILILCAGVVAGFQLGKMPAVLPQLREDLGLGLIAAGWIISGITAVGVVTGMMWGVISDRAGPRRVLLGGLVLIAMGSISGAAAWDENTMLITRIIEGGGYIAAVTAAPALLRHYAMARDHSIVFGIWSFYYPFGMAGMVVASPYLLAVTDWRGIWQINGVIALAMALAIVLLTRSITAPQEAQQRPALLSGIWSTLSNPAIWTLAICFAAYSLIHLSVMVFLPTFLIERRGIAPEEAALLTALAMLMNAPGCLLGGWLIRIRVPAWKVIAASYVGMLICAMGVFSESLSGEFRYFLAMALPFSGGMVPPAVLDRTPVHAVSPALIATAIGLIIQIVSIGQLLGPPVLAALVTDGASWQSATWLTATTAIVGLIAALILRSYEAHAGQIR